MLYGESKLYKHLMRNYVKIRPRKVYAETLTVTVSFLLKQVVDLVSTARIHRDLTIILKTVLFQIDIIIIQILLHFVREGPMIIELTDAYKRHPRPMS